MMELFPPINIPWFCATLAACLLAVRYWPLLETRVHAIIARITSRAFYSSSQELPKFALLRMVFGMILLWRAYDMWVLFAPADHADPAMQFYAVTALLGGAALIVGFLTQYVFLFLLLLQWHYGDTTHGTYSLAYNMGSILSVLLLLVNAGRFHSLDRWLLARLPVLRPWLLYYRTEPTPGTITTAKLLALFTFWLVCLYSLAVHLNEPAWMSGTAGAYILSNNFMSLPYAWFAEQFAAHDWATFLGRMSIWLMLPWYVLVLPGVLAGGILRRYAIGWAILFFMVAKFVLLVGWLAEIEFLLWAALFWSRAGIAYPERFAIAFDDSCNLCDRTVRFVRRVDLFDRARLMPASQNKEWLARYGIGYERAMEDLHGIDLATGRIRSGYNFYIQLSQHIVLLWPLYPILLLGKLLRIGPLIYRFIAAHRRRLFGACTVPSAKPPVRNEGASSSTDRWQRRISIGVALHVALLGLFYLLAIPAPYLHHPGWKSSLSRASALYGAGPIDVFNHVDVRMAENWFTLNLVKDGKEIMVPVFAEDGSRMVYHRSDRIYFHITLMHRRQVIGVAGCHFKTHKNRMDYLARVFLARESYPPGTYRFRYRQYFQQLPDSELLRRNHYVRHEREPRCTVDFTVSES